MQQTVQQAAAANSEGMNALRQGDFRRAAEAFERAVAAIPIRAHCFATWPRTSRTG